MPKETKQGLNKRERFNTKIVKRLDGSIDPDSLRQADFECETLRRREDILSPLTNYWSATEGGVKGDQAGCRIMYDPRPNDVPATAPEAIKGLPVSQTPFTLRLATPHRHLHFKPEETVIGIVTCGGLCPGLNDVVRAVTMSAIRHYHVKRVIGYRYGFWGLSKAGRESAIDLNNDVVRYIHEQGGTFLGSSRGPQKRSEMVDTLIEHNVNVLITIGGDGTQRGAETIASEAKERGLDIAVIGIPKTIDNDLSFSHRTFGYETSVGQAVTAIKAAHAEASSHNYGIGVVKLMGRHSGFIAAEATVAAGVANICLIPERPVSEKTLHNLVLKRFEKSSHCVIVVAEGFGQEWFDGADGKGTDASGNKKLSDIGVYIKKRCEAWLKQEKQFKLGTVKYIDPSYMIRACPPTPSDAAFCVQLANLAIHEAMAGTTNAIISYWYSNFVCVPIRLATSLRREVSINGRLWRQVREITVWLDEDTHRYRQKALKAELEVLNRRRDQLSLLISKL